MTLRYLNNCNIAGIKKTTAPRNPYPSGYGRKIPSQYMLKLNKRWHRVYIMCFANSGSTYVIFNGHELFLTSDAEHALQEAGETAATPTSMDKLTPGDRFRYMQHGVVSTLTEIADTGRHSWRDHTGEHTSWAGSYADTGELAWPLVYPTPDLETVTGQS